MWVKWLFYLQKLIDISIPLGFMFTQFSLALRIIDLPPSLIAVIHDPLTAWLWSLGSFISYLMIIIGVLLKPPPAPIAGEKHKKYVNLGGAYLWFEFPGLIVAGIMTAIYPLALWVNNGLFGSSFAVICFIFTIAIYFILRFLRQVIILQFAKNKVSLTGM